MTRQLDAQVLPWQGTCWQQVTRLWQKGKVPHALLLSGAEGTGIRQFAQSLAQLALCSSPLGVAPCGSCHACSLSAAQTHPDLLIVEPEQVDKPITVGRVREVVAFGQTTAQQGGYRVVILCPAEAMNLNAANSLLKTLEEPGEKCLLLLVSFAGATVLPTIRSRCQMLAMPSPSPEDGRRWLSAELESGAELELLHSLAPRQPLYASRLAPFEAQLKMVAEALPEIIEGKADILKTAAAWKAVDPVQLLHWLYQWLTAACLVDYTAGQAGPAGDIPAQIHAAWSSRASISGLLELLDGIVRLRRQLLEGGNPNQQLLLEQLILDLSMQAA